jgi:cytidine deaminase
MTSTRAAFVRGEFKRILNRSVTMCFRIRNHQNVAWVRSLFNPSNVTVGLVSILSVLSLCFMRADSGAAWRLTDDSKHLVTDSKLREQILHALDAAANAGTDPQISHFQVRAATAFEKDGAEHVVVGGNTEYEVPEAIHAETSLLNHVTTLYGADTTRHSVRFIAFYAQQCGGTASCGDCRDYQLATTDYEHLLVACGQVTDHSVHVSRFTDQIVCERNFPVVEVQKIPLAASDLDRLVKAAQHARQGGINLFSNGHNT